MNNMTVQEIFQSIDSGLQEITGKLASGEIDGSGRFWTDDELAACAASDARLASSGLLEASEGRKNSGRTAA